MTAQIEYSNHETARRRAIVGCILGTAIGDAVGLPCEGLSPARQRKLCGETGAPTLFFGRRMVSDDTEQTCFVARALIESRSETEVFQRSLARQLRVWILAFPAGVGLATLKSCLKLCCGWPLQSAGVKSAGNGPAMRSALIGVCYGGDIEVLRALVCASSRLTHTDARAEQGAFAIALAAHFAANRPIFTPIEYSKSLRSALGVDADELCALVEKAANSAENSRQTTRDFATEIGLQRGVGGYVLHTVPVALHAWLRHRGDFRAAISGVILCGGDTDTTAAIVGALAGAEIGDENLPSDWLASLAEWPHNVRWMRDMGDALADSLTSNSSVKAPRNFGAAIYLRNVFFLCVVLFHGFRRLLPPY